MTYIQGYPQPVYTSLSTIYTRPSDWLTLPTLTSGQQRIVMLHSVYNNTVNYVSFICTCATSGTYTVDWGDGTQNTYATGVQAYHNYSYASFTDSSLCSRGYRQAIISVTTSTTFLTLDGTVKHSALNIPAGYTTGILDMAIVGSSITSVLLGVSSSPSVCNACLEIFNFIGTNAITNCSAMFGYCYNLQLVSTFDTSSVTNMSNMFCNCFGLQVVPFLNTVNVTTMNSMFYCCYKLSNVPLFDTSNVTDTASMFFYCYLIQVVPLFNTVKVTTMNKMFYYCYGLQAVPLFDTGNVIDMSSMFYYCTILQTVPLFNTIKVTAMTSMFTRCYALQIVPLFNTVAVVSMFQMFMFCYSLTTCPNFNTTNVTDMSYMFNACYCLQLCPIFTSTAKVVTFMSMFAYCYMLRNLALNMTMSTVAGSNDLILAYGGGLNLCSVTMSNIKITTSFANCKLDRTSLLNIFNAVITSTGKTLTVTGNVGINDLTVADKAIVTGKGWTLVL